jgi:hypothetical protein
MSEHADSVVTLLNVSKGFFREKIEIPVLTNTTLHIPRGDFVAIMARIWASSSRCTT